MATPVVPNQLAVGKNQIIHKPTGATFLFDPGHTDFRSVLLSEREAITLQMQQVQYFLALREGRWRRYK
jgi:hypothetical protein